MSTDALLESILKLPERDRARIAAELIASLDGEPEAGVEAAWLAEVDRRIAEVDEGKVQLIEWEVAKKQLTEPRR
jgi:putative addiction module component (TIGR02574 family)